ncbi:MAG: hypothetical protein ACD_85C00014G0002 [uncultured bacterium]|nr:MAG: hypothetical protein ACD_85C00014G0002 [uncultured bacterium]
MALDTLDRGIRSTEFVDVAYMTVGGKGIARGDVCFVATGAGQTGAPGNR